MTKIHMQLLTLLLTLTVIVGLAVSPITTGSVAMLVVGI